MQTVSKEQSAALIMLIIIMIIAGGYIVYSNDKNHKESDPANRNGDISIYGLMPQSTEKDDSGNEKNVIVYVCGAVNEPGVYRLPAKSLLMNAIEACGGMTQDGDDEKVNLAREVKNGEMFNIPRKSHPEKGHVENETKTRAQKTPEIEEIELNADDTPCDSKSLIHEKSVNINEADVNELDKLPGIGPGISQRIIDYRRTRGSFQSKEEIKNVAGVGQKLYDKIKDLISI